MSTDKAIIAATVAAGFWRCGRHFTQGGVLVDADDFSPSQWERLKAEPMLRFKAATDEDEAGVQERHAQIIAGIKALAADDFQRDGRPRLDALNRRLGDGFGKISGAERDHVWAAMKENGVEPPVPAG